MRHAHSAPRSWTTATVRGMTLAAVALMAAGSMLLVLERTAAAATPTFSGPATVADGSSDQTELSGGSAALFTFNLPSAAACPGDTTTGGYLVDSYLVPQSTALSSLTFSSGFPSAGFALYNSANNKAYVAQNTNTGTGQISGIPNTFEFGSTSQVGHSRPSLTNLLSGTGVWEAGIACELNGALTDYWNTEITFTASTSDPGGFVWTQVPGNQTGAAGTTTTTGAGGSATTTTTDPSGTTTTTGASGSTTTTSTTTPSSSTTTVAGVSSAASGGTGSGSSGSGSTSGSGSAGTGSSTPGSGTSGTLAFTGFPVGKGIGLGLLAVGIGLVLLAWEPKVRSAFHRIGPP
jgi:hypothetical protein